MRNRVESASVVLLLALATFIMIKLIIYLIGFFESVGVDSSAMASIG